MKTRFIVGVAALLMAAIPAKAQVSAVLEGGSNAGLGYSEPHFAFGVYGETAINPRVGIEGEARWSPDNKRVTGNGNELILSTRLAVGLGMGVAATGGLKTSYLWTTAFNKQSWSPTAGVAYVVDKDNILFFDYVFPTGCEWATHRHPCDIQSNRLHGIEFAEEHALNKRLLLGVAAGVYTFKDQANPVVVSHRTEHTRLVASFYLRVRLG